jgi:hypothetical protein
MLLTRSTSCCGVGAKKRLGKQPGAKVAQVDIARRLAHAIWHMLTRNEPFAPRGAAFRLAARPPSLDMRPERTIQFRPIPPPRRP